MRFFENAFKFGGVLLEIGTFLLNTSVMEFFAMYQWTEEETESQSASMAVGISAVAVGVIMEMVSWYGVGSLDTWAARGRKIDEKLSTNLSSSESIKEETSVKNETETDPVEQTYMPLKAIWAASSSLIDSAIQAITSREILAVLGAPSWLAWATAISTGVSALVQDISINKTMFQEWAIKNQNEEENRTLANKIGRATGVTLCATMSLGKGACAIYALRGRGALYYVAIGSLPIGAALQISAYYAFGTAKTWGNMGETVSKKLRCHGFLYQRKPESQWLLESQLLLTEKRSKRGALCYWGGNSTALVDSGYEGIIAYEVLKYLKAPSFISITSGILASLNSFFQEISVLKKIRAIKEKEKEKEQEKLHISIPV